MPFYAFKQIEVGSIAAGNTSSGSWTADDNYTIEKIFIIDKDGATLYKVTVTVRIDDKVLTRDLVPAMVLAPDELLSPELNLELSKGKTIYFEIKNNDSTAQDIYIVLKRIPKG